MTVESLAEAAERIRDTCPIAGGSATNAECRVRRALIDDALAARGIRPGPQEWHTAQLTDGNVVGVFATSPQEAELDLTVWWALRCHWVAPDPQFRIIREYHPHGKRTATGAAARFPLTPPRRPRDLFAPAASLLDDTRMPLDGPSRP